MALGNEVLTSPTLLRELWNPANREAAWRTFLQRYQPLIHNWCRRLGLGRDNAEDVTAAVLAKLAEELRHFTYDPARRFRGWLKTVVRRAVYDFWKHENRRPGNRGKGGSDVREVLEAVADRRLNELADRLDETLDRDLRQAGEVAARVQARVERHTWEVFWRTAVAGEPAGEVAADLGMKTGAVYVAKRRVGRMLREEGARLWKDGRENKGGGR